MLINFQSPNTSCVDVCSNLSPADTPNASKNSSNPLSPNPLPFTLSDGYTFLITFNRASFFYDDSNLYVYDRQVGRTQALCPLSGRKVLSANVQADGTEAPHCHGF